MSEDYRVTRTSKEDGSETLVTLDLAVPTIASIIGRPAQEVFDGLFDGQRFETNFSYFELRRDAP